MTESREGHDGFVTSSASADGSDKESKDRNSSPKEKPIKKDDVDIDEIFERACYYVRNILKQNVNRNGRLQLYGFYKQVGIFVFVFFFNVFLFYSISP